MINSDISFITNEGEVTLSRRFERLLKQTKFFDCLVGYFYTSGFHNMYQYLKDVGKIRILVGIKTDQATFDLIQRAQETLKKFSTVELKEKFSESTKQELEASQDNKETEDAVRIFIEWINNGKLEIRAYASEKIHAKLYIMTFAEEAMDVGRVITGSSNFTESGLSQNLEFNVELKNRADYKFALKKFNELWKNSVDVSKDYVETIEKKTWLNDNLKPYELYLKFLYEYFKEKINKDQEEIFKESLPEGFMDLKYQMEAVNDAKGKLEEYGGVFLSDVVGLGKTYISAMLAKQLEGGILVLAPPILLDENNPGSWKNVFLDFKVSAHFESIGKLDSVLRRDLSKYKNIFIDEAHRFRTESNITYENLARICSGKRIILVSATPLNNSPKDILSQIKLFQKPNKSTIPNQINLNSFFNKLKTKLKGLDRQTDYDKYILIVKENAKEIREKVLKYLMVRRTRSEIEKYFGEDLKTRHLKFPNIADPESIFYELDEKEDKIFNKTLELITSKSFTYSRYTPLLYYTGPKTQPEEISQRNMGRFMRILLVKRLESSFYAFKKSIERFINYYTKFINNFNRGKVYISKKYTEQIFEALDEGDLGFIDRLVEDKKAEEYKSSEFRKDFILNLKADLKILQEIQQMWLEVKRDPKLDKLINILQSRDVLSKNKIILFTESRETAEYLGANLPKKLASETIVFSGESSAITRDKVIENFDAKSRKPKNDCRILITTEVLSEGVNLHRSNTVLNYDIPWNPTRMMQRVGRINRVDTKFDEIYTFNFFPTTQSNNVIKLKEAAEAKIHAFIEMLGADARLLTEGEEIKSQSLFKRLTSRQTITGEDDNAEDSELKYLMEIRDIRDKDPNLFEYVKNLPKKARTSKFIENNKDSLLSYFRKGKLQKFFLAHKSKTEELDFVSAAKILHSKKEDKKTKLKPDYYELLDKNKQQFKSITTEKVSDESILKGGRDKTTKLLRILNSQEIKNFKGFTEDDDEYLERVRKVLTEGVNEQTLKKLVKVLAKEDNPLKILAKVRANLPEEFFSESAAQSAAKTSGPREVILSVYLSGNNNG